MVDDQLQKLAQTLKNTGMAASMYEAIEKAKSILNVKSQKTEHTQENQQKARVAIPVPSVGVDIRNESATLNQLMKEAGVNPDQLEDQENVQKQEKLDDVQEKIEEIKEEVEEAEQHPDNAERIKEEIEEVKEKIKDVKRDGEAQENTGFKPEIIKEPQDQEMAQQQEQVNEIPIQETQQTAQDRASEYQTQQEPQPAEQTEYQSEQETISEEQNEQKNKQQSEETHKQDADEGDELKEEKKIDLTKIFGNNK
jgi:hypothetical protein